MMVYLQNNMDFENLAGILIKRKCSDLMFALFERQDLRKRNKKKAIFCAFKECMQNDELALAIQIWDSYKSLVTENLDNVLEVLISAYEKSPFLIEVKNYFLSLTMHHLTYEHIDRVLISIEERF